jgi:hypothetical protein
MLSYRDLLSQQEASRLAFGRMLLVWRRRNGWTQYTACTWAKEAGFDAISYGNLSVIEQGKAGELRHKGFWQLGELNRRIAEKDWGPVKSQAIKEKLKGAIPLGDEQCPVWTPLELWACYCGIREVPAAFRQSPAPTIGQRRASELSGRWRSQMRKVVADLALDPEPALKALAAEAPEADRARFFAVLTGFANYIPLELALLWVEGDTYRPQQWLDRWEMSYRLLTSATTDS